MKILIGGSPCTHWSIREYDVDALESAIGGE